MKSSEPGGIRSGEIRRSLERLSPGKWHAPTLINSWVNLTTSTARFRHDGGDVVRVEGVIGGGNDASVAWVMPSDFRPLRSHQLKIRTVGGGTSADGSIVEVATNGNIIIHSTGGAAGGAVTVAWVEFTYSLT